MASLASLSSFPLATRNTPRQSAKKNKNFFITFPISALKSLRRDLENCAGERKREIQRERVRGNNNKYETSQGNNHNNNKNGRKSLKINQSAVAHTHTHTPPRCAPSKGHGRKKCGGK